MHQTKRICVLLGEFFSLEVLRSEDNSFRSLAHNFTDQNIIYFSSHNITPRRFNPILQSCAHFTMFAPSATREKHKLNVVMWKSSDIQHLHFQAGATFLCFRRPSPTRNWFIILYLQLPVFWGSRYKHTPSWYIFNYLPTTALTWRCVCTEWEH